MNTRLSGILLAAAAVAMSGCGAPNTDKKIALQIDPNQLLTKTDGASATTQPSPSGQARIDGVPKQTDPVAPTSADQASLLARKTESYAKSVQDAMAKRNAPAPSPTVAPKANSQDSLVQWLDPNQFKIGDDDSAAQSSPSAPPAQNARQATAVASAAPIENRVPVMATPTQANSELSVDAPKPDAQVGSEINANHASAVLSGSADSTESRITRRFKDYPRDVSANLDYQTMLFLRDQSVPDLSALTSLPTEDRELISAVMDGLSNFRSTLRSDNNMLYSRKIRPLIDLADRLKQQAELSIPTLVLCTKVEGFGVYTPIDPPRFAAQKETEAIIYCELENFLSRQNDARMWQTDVTQEAILYTEEGQQVWTDKTQTIQDLSRNRRHDFFLRTLVRFPSTIVMGRYMLKVTIVDRQANRVAEASLPIQFTAQ
jgi:hypothetical protein